MKTQRDASRTATRLRTPGLGTAEGGSHPATGTDCGSTR